MSQKRRRPQAKKSKHRIVRGIGTIAWDGGLKDIQEMYKLGAFGFFRIDTDMNEWSVTYLPTGQCIQRVIGRKEAEALTKRLYVKVKTLWEPTREEFNRWVHWLDEVEETLNVYLKSRGCDTVKADTKIHDLKPEDFEDDIPF